MDFNHHRKSSLRWRERNRHSVDYTYDYEMKHLMRLGFGFFTSVSTFLQLSTITSCDVHRAMWHSRMFSRLSPVRQTTTFLSNPRTLFPFATHTTSSLAVAKSLMKLSLSITLTGILFCFSCFTTSKFSSILSEVSNKTSLQWIPAGGIVLPELLVFAVKREESWVIL